MAKREISSERKTVYILGIALAILGALMFLSVAISFLMRFGDFTDFMDRSRSEMLRAVAAIVFIFIGFVLMAVAARGVAGAGVILDPQRARVDLEPWARMSGGLLKDALDEANVLQGNPPDGNTQENFDESLRKLHQLHQDGIISAAEYERKKAEILDRA